MMNRHRSSWLLVFLVFTGCATYTPSSAPIPKLDVMPASRQEASVTCGADPYVQVDRQKATFGNDLGKVGILPILIFLQNREAREVLVRPSDIALTLPNGGEVGCASASATAAKFESMGGVIAAASAFGIVGLLVASSAEDKARAARLEDYRRKELKEVCLKKDESAHGFVYFIPPPDTQSFAEATLKVRFIDVEEGTSSVISLPLKGLVFQGNTNKTD